MKNSNDNIGNRSRDLPVCSAVPQPLRHRVPRSADYTYKNVELKSTPAQSRCKRTLADTPTLLMSPSAKDPHPTVLTAFERNDRTTLMILGSLIP
jgi:hypothetical protein